MKILPLIIIFGVVKSQSVNELKKKYIRHKREPM